MLRSHARRSIRLLIVNALAIAVHWAVPARVSAQIIPEAEPNETRANATVTGPLSVGGGVTGTTTGTSTVAGDPASLDQFLVTGPSLPLGIYQHRLTLTSNTVGHTGSIRGFTQTAAPPDTLPGIPWDGVVGTPTTTDTAAQTSSTATTPARFNQWYGFGRGEQFYYRVTGAAATTAPYTATLTSTPVVPTDIGTYQPGQISITTFGQGHTTDTDMWVYDIGFNAIPGFGNDDESPLGGSPGTGASLQSWLSRNFAPGTYFLAVSNFALTNNQPSPSDDDFRTGALLDFPNLILNSSTTTNLNLTFTISDGITTLQVPNTKVGPYDVNWFTFTVVPEPGSMALSGLAAATGVGGWLRRRRAAK